MLSNITNISKRNMTKKRLLLLVMNVVRMRRKEEEKKERREERKNKEEEEGSLSVRLAFHLLDQCYFQYNTVTWVVSDIQAVSTGSHLCG